MIEAKISILLKEHFQLKIIKNITLYLHFKVLKFALKSSIETYDISNLMFTTLLHRFWYIICYKRHDKIGNINTIKGAFSVKNYEKYAYVLST